MRKQIRVLIADQMVLLRRALSSTLNGSGEIRVVAEASDGREAVDLAGYHRPDVVVLEIDLPVVNGVAALTRIRSRQPGVRGVLLAANDSLISLGELVSAECISKNGTPADLVAAIHAANASADGRQGEAIAVRDFVEQLSARTGMTRLEAAVLMRVVESDATNSQIAADLEKLWGKPVTCASIKHALERVMTKLDVEPRTRATLMKSVLTARGFPSAPRLELSVSDERAVPDGLLPTLTTSTLPGRPLIARTTPMASNQ